MLPIAILLTFTRFGLPVLFFASAQTAPPSSVMPTERTFCRRLPLFWMCRSTLGFTGLWGAL